MAHKKISVSPLPRPANAPRRKVFVKGLTLDAFIGAYDHEQGAAQPIRIDLEMEVIEPADPTGDKLEDVVCYNRLTQAIKALINEGRIKLLETLAERISEIAIAHPMVLAVSVRIEKPQAIAEAQAAGVEITRSKI